MPVLKKNRMDLAERADLENAIAKAMTNAAIIDYVAMMADIEIPTEEEEDESEV